mmetsp:Transcript_27944/g.42235  ORF Transcript_27944/g.42235 Transcript_27944/m.42235 type:complete len:157 (+) Transcript_27944:511-981(+)
MLSVIFVAMTFSSGMPILYLILVVSFLITYWIDKCLLLKHYKLTKGYTRYLHQTMLLLLPLAGIVHYFWGFILYSYPFILRTEINHTVWGESNEITLSSLYFNAKRMGQHHMLWYFFTFVLMLFLIVFEAQFTNAVGSIVSCIGSGFRKCWNLLRN